MNDAGVDAMEVTYEELATDPIAAGRSVLGFLDLPTRGVQLQVQTQRQFDETNRAWIARYRAERR